MRLKVAAGAAGAAGHLVGSGVNAEEEPGVDHALEANVVVGRLARAEVRAGAEAAQLDLGEGWGGG